MWQVLVTPYVITLKKTNLEDKDRQCICNCYAKVLKDNAKPIVIEKRELKTVDISDQRGRAIDVIPKIEEILNDLKEQLIKVATIISDNAVAYASACILKNASINANQINYFNHPNNNLVIHYKPPKEISSRSTELYLPTDIYQIIISDLFWSHISQLATLMKPYCGTFDKLQTDKA
ncbi:hypothetical protein RhiirA4_484375 [Rhizophagus irregularis]|uniref:DUF659 domain-containing protein n=1 Tax=Rhizophagus irregularis TaxID=588596 RepID=A0A2I1HNU6_9GLOM|nr:hypothetical protein RhiirA4_484375 [Rhizophagus irregularis]